MKNDETKRARREAREQAHQRSLKREREECRLRHLHNLAEAVKSLATASSLVAATYVDDRVREEVNRCVLLLCGELAPPPDAE